MLGLKLVCTTCNKEFTADLHTYKTLGLSKMPLHCPACNDKRQGRDEVHITKKRELIQEFATCKITLPDKIKELFSPYQSTKRDIPCLRATIKGNLGQGVCWDGRLDIYCLSDDIPEVARVRIMQVTKQKGQQREEKHGEPMGEKQITTVDYSPIYTYMVLEPTDKKPDCALVFGQVDYKYTLKGLGRQYGASLDTTEVLWQLRFSSQARSGRFGSLMSLAVVDNHHPLIAINDGDIKQTIKWDLDNPHGECM